MIALESLISPLLITFEHMFHTHTHMTWYGQSDILLEIGIRGVRTCLCITCFGFSTKSVLLIDFMLRNQHEKYIVRECPRQLEFLQKEFIFIIIDVLVVSTCYKCDKFRIFCNKNWINCQTPQFSSQPIILVQIIANIQIHLNDSFTKILFSAVHLLSNKTIFCYHSLFVHT